MDKDDDRFASGRFWAFGFCFMTNNIKLLLRGIAKENRFGLAKARIRAREPIHRIEHGRAIDPHGNPQR